MKMKHTGSDFLMNLEDYIDKPKPETACFSKADSERVTELIVGMQCVFQIPAFAATIISGNGF